MNSLNSTKLSADSTNDLGTDLAQLFVHDHFIVSRDPDTSYARTLRSLITKQKRKQKAISEPFLYQ